MADGGSRDREAIGSGNNTRPPDPSRSSDIAGRDGSDSDEPLLDISDHGFDEDALILAANGNEKRLIDTDVAISGKYSSQEDGSGSAQSGHFSPSTNVSVSEQDNQGKSSNLSPSKQPRPNPFDFPSAAAWLPTSRTSVTDSSTGDTTVGGSTRHRYDQYDQLNFGDPTFISSYSSVSAARSRHQNPGLISPLGHPPVHNIQHDTKTGGPTDSQYVEISARSANSQSVLAAVSNPYLKDVAAVSDAGVSTAKVNLAPGQSASPIPSGLDRVGGIDKPFLTPSAPYSLRQRGNGSHPPTLFSPTSPSRDISASERAGYQIDNHGQKYDQGLNPDLIIVDYTSSSNPPFRQQSREQQPLFNQSYVERKEQSQDTSHALSRPIGDVSDRKLAMGDKAGYKFEEGMRNKTHASLDNNDNDDPRLSYAPMKENCGNSVYAGGGDRRSHWEEVDEERLLEGAPLLESGAFENDTYRRPGARDVSGRIRDVPGSLRVESATGVLPGASSRGGASRSNRTDGTYASNHLHDQTGQRSLYERGELGNTFHVDTGGEEGSRRRNNARDPRTLVWQRNSYGEFSPLPMSDDSRNLVDGDSPNLYTASFRHCHKRRMKSLTDKLALRQLVAVVVLCVLFMIGEAIGGVLSNSLALFTDVLHLGSDLVSFIISLLALWLSNKPATKRMSFGYHRAEVLGALFSVFLIWLVSGVLCYIAVERIMHEHYKDVKADEMLITASLGVVFNIIMGFVLHSEMCCGHAHRSSKFGHGHSHGGGAHGHSHSHGKDDLLDVARPSRNAEENHPRQVRGGFGYQPLEEAVDSATSDQQMRDVTSEDGVGATNSDEDLSDEEALHKHKNINVRAAFIHVVGDIIQSIGVLVAALIIKFTTDEKFKLADPICTFLFSILVLITTITVLRDTLLVIMEGTPRDLSFDSLKRELLALDGVVALHSLHIWALTLDRNALSVHLAVESPYIHNQVLSSATKLIQDRHHFFHSTIQVELYDETVMRNCKECLEFN